MGITCPGLGTFARLNSHARPCALSSHHSGWRQVLSYSYTYIVFYWKYSWTFQEPGTVSTLLYIDTDIASSSYMIPTFCLYLKG